MNRPDAIILFFLFIAAIIVGDLLFVDFLPKIAVDLDKTLAFIGSIVGGLSFIVGAFFVVLAVSAYSHISDIEATHTNITLLSENFRKTSDSLAAEMQSAKENCDQVKSVLQQMNDMLGTTQIFKKDVFAGFDGFLVNMMNLVKDLPSTGETSRHFNTAWIDFMCLRARLHLADDTIDGNMLLTHLYTVLNYADKASVDLLKRQLNRQTLSTSIREVISDALEKLNSEPPADNVISRAG